MLLWRRGTSVLTASTLMVTRDTRFKLTDGYNLQIANVRIQDAGEKKIEEIYLRLFSYLGSSLGSFIYNRRLCLSNW